MSSLKYELMHGRKYMSAGEEKTAWTKCGAVFESESGYLAMKLEFLPMKANDQGDYWFSMFVPKPREQQPAAPQQQAQQGFREQAPPVDDGFGQDPIPF